MAMAPILKSEQMGRKIQISSTSTCSPTYNCARFVGLFVYLVFCLLSFVFCFVYCLLSTEKDAIEEEKAVGHMAKIWHSRGAIID